MSGLAESQARMHAAGVHPRAIAVFTDFYRQLSEGATGLLPEDALEPLTGLTHIRDLHIDLSRAREAADQTCLIKLNGGLGTTMGMQRAKSLLPVRGERTFLDVVAEQVHAFRDEHGVRLPIVFMNSFRTRDDSRAALAPHKLEVDSVPVDFPQSQQPRLWIDSLTPVDWPDNRSLEWCPPGHGDLYTALHTSGILDALLEAGIRYATVSNSDNLGATPDLALMSCFAASGAPFAVEVCRRTAADVKGGHLAVRRSNGRIVLRESAQTRDEDRAAASDVDLHRYFNTNTLWFDLVRLKSTLDQRGGILGLPLIRNIKPVDPTRPESPKVVQIESAMGAAVEVFDGAVAIEVDRARFLPVKTTNDLLLMRSDVYRDDPGARLTAQVDPIPLVDLDPTYFATISEFDRRIPHPPSLVGARSLTVRGDWTFGRDVVITGDVVLDDAGAARRVPDGARLG